MVQSEPILPKGLQSTVLELIRRVEADTQLRLPSIEPGEPVELSDWLSNQRARYASLMREVWEARFPSVAEHQGTKATDWFVNTYLWPELGAFLQCYVMRGCASAWVSRHMGDRVTLGWPERREQGWKVVLGAAGLNDPVGQIVLDDSGRVLTDQTTTRRELLETIHGSARSHAASATG